MTTVKAIIHDRRIEIAAPEGLPDGTEVVLTISSSVDEGPVSSEEIARVLTAMQKLEPLDISDEVMADLETWEHKINQHGIETGEKGIEDVFR